MRFLIPLCLLAQHAWAQFAPPAGQAGSTAISKDSSILVAWASSCKVNRGLQHISDPTLGYTTVGDSSSPIGMADGKVVSLGDGGSATCTFEQHIYDGPGYDFAVFENSFDGNYLEFGFVEVSSDGIHFFRFPATSNTEDTLQTGAFGDSDASKVNNLAGKYKILYGTPFDLRELQNISGLDIMHISYVRITDVVGSINSGYATYDQNNRIVNDPWPTPYPSSGFDLDAIGVIHQQSANGLVYREKSNVLVYPNPAANTLFIAVKESIQAQVRICISDLNGTIVFKQDAYLQTENIQLEIGALASGIYVLNLTSDRLNLTKKICIQK